MIMKSIGSTFGTFVQTFLSTITTVLWKSGVQIILFLAGLQGISSSLYEAAKCDGATQWEVFWKITLPMISPIILLNFIYSMVTYFAAADNALVEYIVETVFTNKHFARGAAMGWVYFAFAFATCGIVFLIAGMVSKSEER